MPSPKIPLVYTFGNHHHWIDMEWLWGYEVTPDSIRDMLKFCRETGARGNINFEALGYEKVAAESPEALQELKEAVADGRVDPVGCSYGQPYGLFHGPESNLRQRVYGVRTATRLLGKRPETFWEEEFDFFPQLPQLLAQAGFKYASLYFQWTWHTPEVPREPVPVVRWEGLDGTALTAATRNRLNLHQWPEDFQILLDELAEGGPDAVLGKKFPAGSAHSDPRVPPLVLQWLELIPSPDWMCRAELMIPKLQELKADERFDVTFQTLREYLRAAAASGAELPARRYTLDDAWHGMSLGKNGDFMRRWSFRLEHQTLAAETLSSMLGGFGRPYAQWDVYPTWELEEAWRELLQAQHHDNDECEGLCGHVGKWSYQRSESLSTHILDRSMGLLSERAAGASGDLMVYNPLGWEREAVVLHPVSGEKVRAGKVPAFGYAVAAPAPLEKADWKIEGATATLSAGHLDVRVVEGRVEHFGSRQYPAGATQPFFEFSQKTGGELQTLAFESQWADEATGDLVCVFAHPVSGGIEVRYSIDGDTRALDVVVRAEGLPRPDPGFGGALSLTFQPAFADAELWTDSPYAVTQVQARRKGLKKYPSGDWMTSPQWFEEVECPFTSQSLVDFVEPGTGRGVLVLHDGSQQWFRQGEGFRNILNLYDPWDERYWLQEVEAKFRLVPHDATTNAERMRLAQEFRRPCVATVKREGPGDMPSNFSAARLEGKGASLTAWYREMDWEAFRHEDYAAAGWAYPTFARIAEWNGEPTNVRLTVSQEVAKAAKTNTLGERIADLTVNQDAGEWVLELELRPYEIATVAMDIVPARKVFRDLDAHRKVWATVHRTEE